MSTNPHSIPLPAIGQGRAGRTSGRRAVSLLEPRGRPLALRPDCSFGRRRASRKLAETMGYRTLRQCLRDLESTGQLLRIEQEIDPHLEAAEIHRRVFQAGGPALLFARVKGCSFPMASNLFGTMERVQFIFRDTLDTVRKLVEAKVDPGRLARRPWSGASLLPALWHMRPRSVSSGPVLASETTVSRLPALQCWPLDGGPFITLPQVYTEDPERSGLAHSNLGMYRVQLSGGKYAADREVGLHYQIHRGIGVHHASALCTRRGVARECLRGWNAGHERGRRHAAAGGDVGTGICRRARRSSHSHDHARRAAGGLRRGRFLHHRRHRPRANVARRTVRRSPRLL